MEQRWFDQKKQACAPEEKDLQEKDVPQVALSLILLCDKPKISLSMWSFLTQPRL